MKIFSLAILSLFAVSCNRADEASLEAIRESCNGLDLKEVKAIDDISEQCKEALSSLLPQPENNLSSRLYAFGHSSESTAQSYIVSGLSPLGVALSTDSLKELKVYALRGNEEVELSSSQYSLSAVSDTARNALAVSTVIDYSGSMGRQDLNEISSLFSQMSAHLAALARVSVSHFSKEVITRQAFTSERNAIEKALQYNETIVRDSTSLYDAIGQSVNSLSKSVSAGRILIVGTDGQENSSTQFSKETLKVAIAADKKLFVLMVGTFLADSKELRDLAGERGGFIYANTIAKAREKAIEFSKALSQGVEIKFSQPLTDISEIRFKAGAATTSITL